MTTNFTNAGLQVYAFHNTVVAGMDGCVDQGLINSIDWKILHRWCTDIENACLYQHRKNIKSQILYMWSSYHLDLPVNIPLLHVAKAPGLDGISSVGIHPDQTIIGDSNQLFFLSSLKPAEQKQTKTFTSSQLT